MGKGTKPEGDHGAPKAAAEKGGGGGGDVPAAAGEEVVIRVPVHCDGCGMKLRRSLQRQLDGAGEVSVDGATNTVVVRGPKAAGNAAEAVRIAEKRTGRKAVLLSTAPEKLPPAPVKKKGEGTKKDGGKKNKGVTDDDLPEINLKMVVVLRMNLHCDACCEEIKRRILRIKGVEDAVPHLKSSQMMVKGVVEPATLVGFIHNCTGRKAAIFRAEPLVPPPPPPEPSPPAESEAKKQQNTAGKNDEQENNGNKEDEKNKATGGGEEDINKEPKTEKKPDGGGEGDAGEEEEPHGDEDEAEKDEAAGGDVVLESHKKGDHLFAGVPLSAGVVTVAPPVDGAATYYYSYPPSSYSYHPIPYAHPPWYQYQCPPPTMYSPYSYACGGAEMYGYPSYTSGQAFSEENPNTCAIV